MTQAPETINIDLTDKSLYTNVFWKIQKCKKRFVINYGGAGSGKSHSQHQNELINLLDADYDILVLRKSAADIKDSCFTLFKNIAREWGIYHLFKWRYSNAVREIENKASGHRILFRGIDDPEKVKSIVGIKRIIYEEASQGHFADFLELNRRARGIEDIQLVFILNPVSENHWLKTKLLDDPAYADRVDVITSNYKDNRFMTADDIRELEALKEIDENEYRIYVLGEWGIENKNNKFAYAFDRSTHVVQDVEHAPDEYTHLSFDFNKNPITCAVIQDYDEVTSVVEQIKLANSDIYKLCDYIKASYPHGTFIVTGDASGASKSAMVKDDLDYFMIIKQELSLLQSQFKVPKKNPSLIDNRVLVNAALKNLDIEISEHKGAGLIYDLTYCEVGEDKKLLKDSRTDEKQKADSLDCFRYWLNVNKSWVIKNKYRGQ